MTPHKLATRDQRSEMALFKKRHERRKVPHVGWLDALALSDVELAEQEAARDATHQLALNIVVPEFEQRVVYHQRLYNDVVEAPLRALQPIYDAELALPNPIELAHVKLSRGTRLARADRDLKPLTDELELLNVCYIERERERVCFCFSSSIEK